tara:strand:+ start:23997 stop:25286 length:1290 start_codon:yes stop_codon:yes gene_type:complete
MLDLLILISLTFFLLLVLYLRLEVFFGLNLIFLVIESFFKSSIPLALNILGVSVYVQDIFFLVISIYIILYIFNYFFKNKSLPNNFYFFSIGIVFSFIVLKSLFSFQSFGTTGILSSKPHLYFFSVLLYFSIEKIPLKKHFNILKTIFITSIFIIFFTTLRYFNLIPGLYEGIDNMQGFATSFNANRILNRLDLMILSVSFIFSFSYLFHCSKRESLKYILVLLVTPILSLLLLFSYTRSVLLVSIIGFVCLLINNKIISKKLVLFFSAFSLIIFFNLVINLISSESAFSYENLFGQTSTLSFRAFVNVAYLNYMNFTSYIYGMTFGDYPIVFESLYFIDENAGKVGIHNFYMELLYYLGLPILSFFIFLMLKIFRRLIYISKNFSNKILYDTLLCSFVMYIIFYLAWTPDFLNSLLLGISINCILENN